MYKRCCDRKQVTCFKLLSQVDIEQCRSNYYSLLKEVEKNQYLITYMREHSKGNKSVLYTVGGQKVCEASFRMAYGVRYNKFETVKKKFEEGVVAAAHGLVGTRHSKSTSIRVVSWLRMFIKKVGDYMPTSIDIHLPSCLTKADVYALTLDDLSQGGLDCCKRSTFYDVWKAEFSNVKIPKVNYKY